MKRDKNNQLLFLLIATIVSVALMSCSQRALHEAQSTVVQADSLWRASQPYSDSTQLAQAYKTLTHWQSIYPDEFVHACYHYGRLLRQQDNPVDAMQAFIDATHTRTHDYHILGRVYSNMGSICHLAGEFSLSYDMYKKSANKFLCDGDTLSYYYLLNDMAFELAEQGKKDEAYLILNDMSDLNSDLLAGTILTKAVACKMVQQYDSTIYYTSIVHEQGAYTSEILLNRAQAYSLMGQKDSAVFYANMLLANNFDVYDECNALYILTNDDDSQSINDVRKNAADRADSQKIIENRKGKLLQAVQLLEQDLARKADLTWLYVFVATLVFAGTGVGLYITRKRKKHALLSQKIENLEVEYTDLQSNRLCQIEKACAVFRNSKTRKVDLCWNDYESMCKIVNEHFYLLANKLIQMNVLNESEIRLCILVLFDLSRQQIADILPYSLNGIGKLKYRVAQKLGTNGANLRNFLIQIALNGVNE